MPVRSAPRVLVAASAAPARWIQLERRKAARRVDFQEILVMVLVTVYRFSSLLDRLDFVGATE